MKSKQTDDIGHAIMDIIEAYNTAKESEYVKNPVAYALYQTWTKYDREGDDKE